jgi:outer membrane protein OmpU
LVLSAAPASAEGIELNVGGHFKGYGAFVDQDETAVNAVNDFDMIRTTEIHFGGETTLDNGLTVGAHFETEADTGDALSVDESYVYFSGGWGRVNVGGEDGAGYLLQVAAPSADSNIDGIRQYVQPVNYTIAGGAAAFSPDPTTGGQNSGGLDYDMDVTGKTDKVTYLSPIMSGFQVGVSYTPDSNEDSAQSGIGTDDVAGEIGATYEAAVRYEGEISGVGVIAGAGYAHGDLEADQVGSDDREAWNVGVDLNAGAFGVGVIYREDNGAQDGAGVDDEETFVVGVDYTTGAFKLGASYLDQQNVFATEDLDATRYSGGVTYTYGPGMTFRGSIGYVEFEDGTAANDVDATYVTLGTQINF